MNAVYDWTAFLTFNFHPVVMYPRRVQSEVGNQGNNAIAWQKRAGQVERRNKVNREERHYVDCNCATSEANWIGLLGQEMGYQRTEKKKKKGKKNERAWLARFHDFASSKIATKTRSRDDNGPLVAALVSSVRLFRVASLGYD